MPGVLISSTPYRYANGYVGHRRMLKISKPTSNPRFDVRLPNDWIASGPRVKRKGYYPTGPHNAFPLDCLLLIVVLLRRVEDLVSVEFLSGTKLLFLCEARRRPAVAFPAHSFPSARPIAKSIRCSARIDATAWLGYNLFVSSG